MDCGTRAVAVARALPTKQLLIMSLVRSAEAHLLAGDKPGARPLVVEALTLLRALGTFRWVAECHEIAAIVLAEDDPPAAAVELRAAAHLRDLLGEPAGAGFVLGPALAVTEQQVVVRLSARDLARCSELAHSVAIDEAIARTVTSLG